ncbi:hypothetical protein TNCV_3926071 [Trichonephila clavipes]|nr:hypothetical protein TNCV_3926071 [Trichonephila clavipes]
MMVWAARCITRRERAKLTYRLSMLGVEVLQKVLLHCYAFVVRVEISISKHSVDEIVVSLLGDCQSLDFIGQFRVSDAMGRGSRCGRSRGSSGIQCHAIIRDRGHGHKSFE